MRGEPYAKVLPTYFDEMERHGDCVRATLAAFDEWLRGQDLQCIATRVSTGSECTLIIEDGEVKEGEKPLVLAPRKKTVEKPSDESLSDSDY